MTKKHFIAIHNETGDRIEFGVEDIAAARTGIALGGVLNGYDLYTSKTWLSDWLSEYTLYYLHQGEYYNYETQEEMV